MKTMMDVPYSASQDERCRMDWFIPDQANGCSILFIHGGGWAGGHRKQWQPVAAHFAGLGFTCASAGYRLSPRVDVDGIVSDARLAMAYMRREVVGHGLRGDRIAAVGSSAGGHLVALLGTIGKGDMTGASEELADADTRPNAVICYCPVTSLCDEGHVKGYNAPSVQAMMGGLYEEKKARYAAMSPLLRLSAEAPPFLFLHGDADTTVPLRHSTEAHRLLVELGVTSQLIVLPGVGHGFGYGSTTPAQKMAMAHVERFLRSRFDLASAGAGSGIG